MPLQNRVDPFGEIRAVQDRGMLTGNRGTIHDPDTKTLLKSRWATRAWIACDPVHPRGKTREVFGRNAPGGGAGWTELFFLDEVTALAAGHRPCFYCRRHRAADFAAKFREGNGARFPSVRDIDARLHAERPAVTGSSVALEPVGPGDLPNGTVVCLGDAAYALRGGRALPWSFSGYGKPVSLARLVGSLRLLTPPSTVAALRAGYRPAWHSSASGS